MTASITAREATAPASEVFRRRQVTCRASSGQCDVAESCTGTSGRALPTPSSRRRDVHGASNGGACDGADHCSGTNNSCVEVFQASSVTCRASSGSR
jgi:hypothetical protein